MKVQHLFEVTKKTKTQTKPQDDPFLSAFARGAGMEDKLPAAPAPERRQRPTQQQAPRLRSAAAERTAQRMAGVQMPAGAEERLQAIHDLDLDDEMTDDEVAQRVAGVEEPKTPGTDVARRGDALTTIGTSLVAAGEVQPEWHEVRHLPGYLQRAIRSMGRHVFAAVTTTPLEDIQVIASLGDSGEPNTVRETNAVAAWLKNHGKRDTDGEMNFQRVIPGYMAKFLVYSVGERKFLVVKDFAGNYVYSWPSADEKEAEGSKQRVLPQLRPRLR